MRRLRGSRVRVNEIQGSENDERQRVRVRRAFRVRVDES
jgi:hypothetical protein